MDYSEAKKLVKARLSEKRWTHTKNVKKMAVKLARRWGTDPEKAAMAAILHDSAKELPKQELLQIFADNAKMPPRVRCRSGTASPPPSWPKRNGASPTRKFCLLSAAILPASRECPSSIRSSIWPI